jgi:hypothetical protein
MPGRAGEYEIIADGVTTGAGQRGLPQGGTAGTGRDQLVLPQPHDRAGRVAGGAVTVALTFFPQSAEDPGQLVNGLSRWLKSQGFCVMPEQVLLSRVPGQPPLSRWIAQIDRKFMLLAWAKFSIVCASGR